MDTQTQSKGTRHLADWGLCAAVMEDLLAAFMGLDGRYARARLAGSMPHPHLSYCLEGRPDPALHELVTRMLPIW